MADSTGELRKVFENKVKSYTICDALDNIRATRARAADYIHLLIEWRDVLASRIGAADTLTDVSEARAAGKAMDDAVLRRETTAVLGVCPFMIADNIETASYVTSGGLDFLDQWQTAADHPAIGPLIAAGAVFFGKAPVQELGFGVLGTNVRYGNARNPYAPSHICGGSNGGLAAAISSRICTAGIGLDTLGGLRIPASLTGIVGFRPSASRYSHAHHMPTSYTLDNVGLMGRSAKDLLLLDAVILGSGVTDTKALPSTKLTGVRIGVPRGSLASGCDASVDAVFASALERLSGAGAVLVEADPATDVCTVLQSVTMPILGFEMMREVSRYLYEAGQRFTVLDIIDAFPGVEKARLEGFVSGNPEAGGVHHSTYTEVLVSVRPALQAAMAAYFRDNNIEAWVYPTTRVAARPLEEAVTGSVLINGAAVSNDEAYARNVAVASTVNFPAVSVPAGMTEGATPLPVGIEFSGLPGSDERLLTIARAFQETFHTPLPMPKVTPEALA